MQAIGHLTPCHHTLFASLPPPCSPWAWRLRPSWRGPSPRRRARSRTPTPPSPRASSARITTATSPSRAGTTSAAASSSRRSSSATTSATTAPISCSPAASSLKEARDVPGNYEVVDALIVPPPRLWRAVHHLLRAGPGRDASLHRRGQGPRETRNGGPKRGAPGRSTLATGQIASTKTKGVRCTNVSWGQSEARMKATLKTVSCRRHRREGGYTTIGGDAGFGQGVSRGAAAPGSAA